MLTEEALILVATLGASGLLVLGVVELIWPARPRGATPRARTVAAEAIVARRLEAAKTLVAPPEPADPDPVPISSDGVPASSVVAASGPAAASETAQSSSLEDDAAPAPPALEPAPTALVAEPRQERMSPPIMATARATADGRPHVLPIDTCRTMYEEGRFTEVVSLGSAALEVHAGLAAVSHRPYEAAALLDLVGLAKQALGDHAGALSAFEAAVQGADPAARSSCVGHLVAAVRVLADAEPASDSDTVRVRKLRACLAALDRAVPVAPADDRLLAVRAGIRETLSVASERLASRLGTGDAGADAQDLVCEALADSEMPPAWRERLRDELTAASSAEIGQLTAQAIRLVQEGKDGDALEALERAERLSAALPAGAVTEERREEFERRLWWGYSKVALRRLETQSYESALEPLFRALRFGSADRERATETRGVLVRALEGVVETGTVEMGRLSGADPRLALAEVGRLSELLKTAGERGVHTDELADLFTALRELERRVLAPSP